MVHKTLNVLRKFLFKKKHDLLNKNKNTNINLGNTYLSQL